MMYQVIKKGGNYKSPIGTICVTNYLPYIGKVVNVYVEDGETYTVYEPAGIEEARKQMNAVVSHLPKAETDVEKRIEEAAEVTWQLAQQSWLEGVPVDAKIFCDAHYGLRPAHGANRYDHILLCNDCVGRVEREIAEHVIFDVHAWTEQQAGYNQIHQSINQAEEEGYKVFQLDKARWMELFPLYKFHRGAKPESDQTHYPYPDIRPTFYEGWIRDDREPGMETIYFTSRNKLFNYLLNGGHVEKKEEA